MSSYDEFTDPRVSWYGITPTGLLDMTYTGPSPAMAKKIMEDYGIGIAPAVRDLAGIDAMAPRTVAPIPTPRPSQPNDMLTAPPGLDGKTGRLAGRRMFDPQPGVQERMEGFGPPTTPMPDVMPQLRRTYAPHPVGDDFSRPMPGLAPQPMPFTPSPYNPAPQPLPDRRAAAENALRQALAERALTAPLPAPSPLQQALMDRMLR